MLFPAVANAEAEKEGTGEGELSLRLYSYLESFQMDLKILPLYGYVKFGAVWTGVGAHHRIAS